MFVYFHCLLSFHSVHVSEKLEISNTMSFMRPVNLRWLKSILSKQTWINNCPNRWQAKFASINCFWCIIQTRRHTTPVLFFSLIWTQFTVRILLLFFRCEFTKVYISRMVGVFRSIKFQFFFSSVRSLLVCIQFFSHFKYFDSRYAT